MYVTTNLDPRAGEGNFPEKLKYPINRPVSSPESTE